MIGENVLAIDMLILKARFKLKKHTCKHIHFLHFNMLHEKHLMAQVTYFFGSHFSLGTNYDFCLNKILICCLIIVSKVVVRFIYVVGLRNLKYGNAE